MAESSSSLANNRYTGRFAPSPTGPLHYGSLVAAVASFVDARSNDGTWLIRMEDLDPQREPPGAADIILGQLNDFGMESDRPVLYQSSRSSAYQEALSCLESQALCFFCDCSRQDVRAMGGVYDGTCRERTDLAASGCAIRVKVEQLQIAFVDQIQGLQRHNIREETGDFIIKRKDGLFAYQLAVVVDDAFQKITHVVRGFDLIDSTARQIYLQNSLGLPVPHYAHVPIIVNKSGQKLSKQHFAEPVNSARRQSILHATLQCLGQQPPDKNRYLEVKDQLDWAIEHWDIQAVPKLATMRQDSIL